ncbi:hypothetical protein LCGC14_0877990, partial [marine sediment metagenome]
MTTPVRPRQRPENPFALKFTDEPERTYRENNPFYSPVGPPDLEAEAPAAIAEPPLPVAAPITARPPRPAVRGPEPEPPTVAAARTPSPARSAAADRLRGLGGPALPEPRGDEPSSLGTAALQMGLAQLMPGRKLREKAEERILERTRPEEITKTLFAGRPADRPYEGMDPGMRAAAGISDVGRPERKPITGADVLGAAAGLGTAAREYGYLRLFGVPARVGGAAIGRLAQAESKLFPALTRRLAELAGRSTAASRTASAVESAARGAGEGAVFGVARETAEEGPSLESAERGAGYALFVAPLGGLLGALTALRISPSRAIMAPREVARAAEGARIRAQARNRGRVTPEEEAAFARQVLGVEENATADEISAAFRQRGSTFHPEGETPDVEIFKVFSEAKSVLQQARATPKAAPARPARAPEPAEAPVRAPEAAAPAYSEKNPFKPGIRQRVADVIDPERAGRMERLEVERRSAQREAETDELTGLGNRRAFQRARQVSEEDPETELVILDVNNLKAANDLVGHEFGDERLTQAAAAIQRAQAELGVPERAFRTGGDEFVAIVPRGTGDAVAARAADTFGEVPAGEFQVSLTGTSGATFADADAKLQEAKLARKGEASYRPSPPHGVEQQSVPEVPEAPVGEAAGGAVLPSGTGLSKPLNDMTDRELTDLLAVTRRRYLEVEKISLDMEE